MRKKEKAGMNRLEKLRELVLQELSGYQCMAEDPYISFERSLIIKGKLMSLRWILNRIDELMKEASDEIQTHTALRP